MLIRHHQGATWAPLPSPAGNKTSVHDWYINDDPPALTAFRAGASAYVSSARW